MMNTIFNGGMITGQMQIAMHCRISDIILVNLLLCFNTEMIHSKLGSIAASI